MVKINEIYKNLTNVDIEEQKMIWDERGKGYYGEYLVFSNLYSFMPGDCKILMNLEIPAVDSKTTEVDLLLIHESGIYVFEIKHYKGRIYGKDGENTWTQYFRTTSNNTFLNPVEQNNYHIRALQKIFPEIPIQSVIVFTSDDCELKIENSNQNLAICKLSNLKSVMFRKISSAEKLLSMQDIDNYFNKLSEFSPKIENQLTQEEPATFETWLKPFIDSLNEENKKMIEAQENYNKNIKKLKNYRNIVITLGAIFVIICIAVSNFAVASILEQKEAEMAVFKQNFMHIDEIDNTYIDSLKTYISVTNQQLKPLTDDAVSFTARLKSITDTYGIVLQENTKYIVMKTDGKVYEYDMFGESLRYSWISNIIGEGYRSYGDLKKIEFYGISDIEEIEYIKITNIELIKLDVNRTVIKDNLELELYSK